jgi:hypothetical protein
MEFPAVREQQISYSAISEVVDGVDCKFSSSAFGNPAAWLRTKAIWMLEKVPHSMHLVVLRTAKSLTLFMPP